MVHEAMLIQVLSFVHVQEENWKKEKTRRDEKGVCSVLEKITKSRKKKKIEFYFFGYLGLGLPIVVTAPASYSLFIN